MAQFAPPSLFGIKKSNRDFSLRKAWGKNQFNSAFPAALACYFHQKKLQAVCRRSLRRRRIARHSRSVFWILKMLFDFANEGKMNPMSVIDELTYDTKNDKAFAVSGKITRQYMKSPFLLKPRVKKEEIKSIILGGGERFLSPERRFDAAVLSARGLF